MVSKTENGTQQSCNLNSLYVGRDAVGSLSRALMRFPKLDLSEIASGGSIQEAAISVRDLMCQSDENITIDCHVYNMAAPAWSEAGTTTWAGVGNAYLGELLDSHLVSFGQGNHPQEQQRIEQVVSILGNSGTEVGSGMHRVQYVLSTGETVILNYICNGCNEKDCVVYSIDYHEEG